MRFYRTKAPNCCWHLAKLPSPFNFQLQKTSNMHYDRQHGEAQVMTSGPVSGDKLVLGLLPSTHPSSFHSLKWTWYSHSETCETETLKTKGTLLWYTFLKESQQILQLGFRSPTTLFAPWLDQGEGQTGVLVDVDGQLDKNHLGDAPWAWLEELWGGKIHRKFSIIPQAGDLG